MATETASPKDFDTLIEALVKLALDNSVSKQYLLQFLSEVYDRERNNRRSPQ